MKLSGIREERDYNLKKPRQEQKTVEGDDIKKLGAWNLWEPVFGHHRQRSGKSSDQLVKSQLLYQLS